MSHLASVMRGMWSEMTGTHPYPSEAVKERLQVANDALYMAHRLKKEPPAYNAAVLCETARLLGVEIST